MLKNKTVYWFNFNFTLGIYPTIFGRFVSSFSLFPDYQFYERGLLRLGRVDKTYVNGVTLRGKPHLKNPAILISQKYVSKEVCKIFSKRHCEFLQVKW